MLPDYKSRCPSIAPLLQPQRRKYLFGGIGLFILIVTIIVVVYILTSGNKEIFVLDRTPLFAGRNNLPQNLDVLIGNNLTRVDLNSDLKNDTIFGENCTYCNTDLPRLSKGQVSSQFWVARAGCNESTRVSDVISQLDVVSRMIRKYSSCLQLVKKPAELEDVYENKKVGSLILVDGGQSLMNTTAFLRMFFELGVRGLSLADGCNDSITNYIEEDGDLSEFGKMAVNEMNKLGMMIDIQGLSTETQNTILNMSAAPVMMSHTAAAALQGNKNNIDDQMLDSMKSHGGLVMVTFDTPYLGSTDNISISDVIRHINYIVDKIGFDNIAIGGNFDSMYKKPAGLEDVSDFPSLFKELKSMNSSKWTADNLDKLAGLNFGRFFKDVEKVQNLTKIMEDE